MPSFLVLELPVTGTQSARFTRAHPGARIDTFVDAGGPGLRALVQASGAPREALETLLAAASATYPDFEVQSRKPDGSWVASVGVPLDTLDPTVAASARLLRGHGLQVAWVRIEDGVTYARALIPKGADAQGLAKSMRDALRAAGIDADVDIEEESNARLAEWLGLLQDMATRRGA